MTDVTQLAIQAAQGAGPKRPPEMVELHRHALLNGSGLVEFSNGHWIASEPALAAIRSLRVKLFRKQAALSESRMEYFTARTLTNPESAKVLTGLAIRHAKASLEFSRIADAIERGER